MDVLGLSRGDVLILVALVGALAILLAVAYLGGSRDALRQLGRPPFTRRRRPVNQANVEEVRAYVLARNESLRARGKEPLDVDEEVARRLRELGHLGN